MEIYKKNAIFQFSTALGKSEILLNFQNTLVIQSSYKVSPNAGLERDKELTRKFSIMDGNTLLFTYHWPNAMS